MLPQAGSRLLGEQTERADNVIQSGEALTVEERDS